MYTGLRDPEIPIIVPKSHCHEYLAKDKNMYIEIFIPPENYTDYDKPWGSIMLKPTQVFFLPNDQTFNQIMVNDEANIINSTKDENRKVLAREVLTPKQIIGRELKYWKKQACEAAGFIPSPELSARELNSQIYYTKFEQSGMQMYQFILAMYHKET